jgi:uncharacterized protein (TIGR00725 family)
MESSSRNREPGAATYVAVIGPGEQATQAETDVARQVGQLLADRGAILVCGGLGGVMAAASEGACDHGGLTIGLLPGRDRAEGNPHLSVVLPTGLGELRNGLVVGVSDAVIAVGGSWGTLSEIALAMRSGKPTVVINGWVLTDPVSGRSELPHGGALSAEQAVDEAIALASARMQAR